MKTPCKRSLFFSGSSSSPPFCFFRHLLFHLSLRAHSCSIVSSSETSVVANTTILPVSIQISTLFLTYILPSLYLSVVDLLSPNRLITVRETLTRNCSLREEWRAAGLEIPEEDGKDAPFDSNVITPGTPFMDRLAAALRRYAADRIKSNPAWSNLKVSVRICTSKHVNFYSKSEYGENFRSLLWRIEAHEGIDPHPRPRREETSNPPPPQKRNVPD